MLFHCCVFRSSKEIFARPVERKASFWIDGDPNLVANDQFGVVMCLVWCRWYDVVVYLVRRSCCDASRAALLSEEPFAVLSGKMSFHVSCMSHYSFPLTARDLNINASLCRNSRTRLGSKPRGLNNLSTNLRKPQGHFPFLQSLIIQGSASLRVRRDARSILRTCKDIRTILKTP